MNGRNTCCKLKCLEKNKMIWTKCNTENHPTVVVHPLESTKFLHICAQIMNKHMSPNIWGNRGVAQKNITKMHALKN